MKKKRKEKKKRMKTKVEINSCFKGKNIFSLIKRKRCKDTVLLHNCIETLLSDPVVVLYTDCNFICAGTLTGRVTLFKIHKTENVGINTNISFSKVRKDIVEKGEHINEKDSTFKDEEGDEEGNEEGDEDDLTKDEMKDGMREKEKK